jgi:MFS family permease
MMFLAAAAGIILMYLLANAPASQAILAVLLFLNGLAMTATWSLYVSYPMGFTTAKTFPFALSIGSTAASLGGFFSPMIAGYLLDVFKSFSVVFYFFALTFVITFVLPMTTVEPLQTIGAEKK